MQVKRLFVTITVLFSLLLPIFAQAQRQERPIVRLIYFLPSDREPQPDIDKKMDKLIKDVQRFYASQMKAHGFGGKTFRFETNRRGKAVVHHVVGQYTDRYYNNLSRTWEVWTEIDDTFDISKDFYITAVDISSKIINRSNACGVGSYNGSTAGKVLIPASGGCFNVPVTTHELGHAFGLQHDFRADGVWIPSSYTYDPMVRSFCAAEWLDAHRAFNPGRPSVNNNTPTEIKMLLPSFASPPNAIRLRFEVTDPDGLHQAQLLTPQENRIRGGLISCKGLNGTLSRTIEFVTTEVTPKKSSVSLFVIDAHGNFARPQKFSIDMTSLLPSSQVISIPDSNLAAAVRRQIGDITTYTILNLTRLDVPNRGITDLTGIEHAYNLRELNLGGEYIDGVGFVNSNGFFNFSRLEEVSQLTTLNLSLSSLSDISFLEGLPQLTYLYLQGNNISDAASFVKLTRLRRLDLSGNSISDISSLAALTQLDRLYLSNNAISDVSALAGLTQLRSLLLSNNAITDVSALAGFSQLAHLHLNGNSISDISPLLALNRRGIQWYLQGNPLSYTSIYRHIPAMQAKGIEVHFDPRTPTTLTKRLGDAQQGKPGKALATPFVVEVKDEKGVPFAGVPIRFTVTAGGGKVRPVNVVSDITGRAETTLILGPNLRTNTVRVNAAKIRQPVIFTATATDNPPPTFRKPTTFSVAENTTAIGKVKAVDADRQDSVTGYAISSTAGEDSAKFSITPTGVLRFKTPPDYERPTTASRTNKYIVLVSATGGTGKRARTGTQPFTITVTDINEPPDKPTAPTVIPATPTSLIVSWEVPANTGPLMTYEVRYRSGNASRFIKTEYNGTQPNFTLNDLTRGKKYQVQVRAKNAEGRSAWSPSGIGTPQASPPIDFPDAALRAKIAASLSKASNATITAVDMLALTKLEAPNANIQNLAGIEHAHNLTTLSLGVEYISGKGYVNSNTISDFSRLAGLTNLKTLNLSYGSLTDVSFLASLTQLTSLSLGHNSISDVSALSDLTQLTQLYLENNPIADVSPLAGLTQLTHLNLSSSSISDISPLVGLTQLRGLYLYGTSLSDVSTLSSLTQLTSLGISGTSVSDISALAGLTQLISLYLGRTSVSDISALAGLTQLISLNLDGNSISDVSALSDLTQLTVLNLRNNAILDVSPLVGLELSGAQWDSTGLYIERNPLSYASINTHIPTMQAKGVEIRFDSRTPTTLVKISGAAQQGTVNAALPLPCVVEVRDQQNQAFAGVPVTFTITAGDGRLSATSTTTDATGRAKAHLTLGRTAGTMTVRVAASKISQPVQFTATALLLSAPVSVPDVALRTEIASVLGKPQGGSLTVADMLTLTALTANDANIRDLTGLQHAPNLKTLSLDGNSISDVGPLAGLPQLTRLSLNSNNLSNMTPLAGLTRLEVLSLDNNNLSDVTPLVGMTQLKTLSLDDNSISDVAPLEELTHLRTLQLGGNLLSYPSLHTHLPAIQARGATVSVDSRTPTTLVKISGTHGVVGAALPLIIEVQDEKGFGFSGVPVTFTVTAGGGHLSAPNLITDVTGRARTTLTLGATPGKNIVRATTVEGVRPVSFTITTVDANSRVTVRDTNLHAKIAETLGKPRGVQLTVGDMLMLTRLDAPNATIQNLSGLEHAHNLTYLNLSGEYVREERQYVNSNTVSDFSPLFGLTQLRQLHLFFSSLTDISFLSNMPQLTWLRLSNNDISDISVLAGLTQLTYLDLSNTLISDVSSLTGLTQLSRLYLSSPSISDVSPLAGLTQLASLLISSTSVSDVSPLAGLTQLTVLNLYNNDIADVSALSGLTQLIQLELRNNAILDVLPLVGLDLPGTQWNSTGLYIEGNPLNHASVHTHIPAMQARGVEVQFDNRAHSALVKISGDTQESEAGRTLAAPFVVEALNPHGAPMIGLSVTFRVTEGGGKLSAMTVTTDANGRAQITLTLGPHLGVNKVRVAAAGVTYPVTFTATATEITLLAAYVKQGSIVNSEDLMADVNEDGIVDIQDLVLVSSNFGQTGQNSADVNGDGVVNIADLVLVAGAFGGGAAAPPLHPSDLEGFTAAQLQDLLTQARQMALTDPAYLRGIVMLEQLLIALIPRETALLVNYPNPFNPETWIPYQLAKSAEVTLHIYAVDGALVRTLALGHQPAGMYHSKSRAAYWDGRNEQGERVASGVYFYTLTAEDFTATRKLLIRK